MNKISTIFLILVFLILSILSQSILSLSNISIPPPPSKSNIYKGKNLTQIYNKILNVTYGKGVTNITKTQNKTALTTSVVVGRGKLNLTTSLLVVGIVCIVVIVVVSVVVIIFVRRRR